MNATHLSMYCVSLTYAMHAASSPRRGARVDSGSSCSRPCSSSPGLLGGRKRETLCYSRVCELRRAPLSLSTDTGTKNKGRGDGSERTF